MNLKILNAAMCLSLLMATASKGLTQAEPLTGPTLQQVPSSLEQLTKPSQIQQLQRLVQQQPLLYLFLQLQEVPAPNLQQEAEAQIRQILQQPPSLQQQLIQQQVRGSLELENLGGKKPK